MSISPYETAIAIRELVRGLAGSAHLGALQNVMTSPNDLIIGGLNGSPVRLPMGVNGQVLKVVDGALTYADVGGGASVSYPISVANGGTGSTNATDARTALGLGDSATLNVGSSAGTVASGNHSHSGAYEPANSNVQTHISSSSNPHSTTASQVGALSISNNLSDLTNASTARSNLGLGSAASSSSADFAPAVIAGATYATFDTATGKMFFKDFSNATQKGSIRYISYGVGKGRFEFASDLGNTNGVISSFGDGYNSCFDIGATNNASKAYYGLIISTDPSGAGILRIGGDTDTNGEFRITNNSVTAKFRLPNQSTLIGSMVLGSGGAGLVNTASSNGRYNTLIGIQAGNNATTTEHSTTLGYQAGRGMTSGSRNVNVGSRAGYTNTTGSDNVFIGDQSGYRATTSSGNTIIGSSAGNQLTTGYQNTALGQTALSSNTVGYYNVALGYNALAANTCGYDNVAIGFNAIGYLRPTSLALTSITDGGSGKILVTSNGHGMTGSPVIRILGTTNYDGTYNSVTVVDVNTFTVTKAYVSNETSGWWWYQDQAKHNVAIGTQAARSMVRGSQNVFVGDEIGLQTSPSTGITDGDGNVLIGFGAARQLSSGSAYAKVTNSVYIGSETRALSNDETNAIVIGSSATSRGSNTTVIGNSSTTQTYINGNVSSTSVQVSDPDVGNVKTLTDSDKGTIRYREGTNNSYADMVMKTGASTYSWVTIYTNAW